MVDSEGLKRLARLREAAPPEVRKLVDWAGTELADRLTVHYVDLGLPPMLARKEAEAAARILLKRVIGIVKAFHRWGV
jgi:hypothetical protein